MTNTAATRTPGPWTEDPQGFMEDGGDVGGDYQASAAPSRRFTRDLGDGTYGVIDVYGYIEVRHFELDESGARTGSISMDADENTERDVDVTIMTTYTRCEDLGDVGGSDISSDMTYEHPYDVIPQDDDDRVFESAKAAIKRLAPSDYEWDGISDIRH